MAQQRTPFNILIKGIPFYFFIFLRIKGIIVLQDHEKEQLAKLGKRLPHLSRGRELTFLLFINHGQQTLSKMKSFDKTEETKVKKENPGCSRNLE